MNNITNDIYYIGASDNDVELFENQYDVPEGMAYNSYVIKDEKIAVLDTIDERLSDAWLSNLKEVLGSDLPDYLIVSHVEPDHSANIKKFIETYPDATVVGNAKTFGLLSQFYDLEINEDKKLVVAEGTNLSLGSHNLTFAMAPMVHWPEVMVTYDEKDKVLFAADAFGKFGANNDGLFIEDKEAAEEWCCEARRYYTNIVGRYGVQVQALLKKAGALDIEIIAPLHGPVLKAEIPFFIDKYNTWSSYATEDEGVTLVYATLHGNTRKAAEYVENILKEKNVKYEIFDLSDCDVAEVIESAFRYDKMILASVTYDAGIMPCMMDALYHFKLKNVQNKKIALIQNGSWAPMSGKIMREQLETLKNVTILDNMVTIKSSMTEENKKELDNLVAEILA